MGSRSVLTGAAEPAVGRVDVRRLAVLAGWTAFLTPFAIRLVAIIRGNGDWLVQALPDDALYYLEIARRLGAGQGFTFDGIHATNGFHPLWQFVLVPFALVFDGDTALMRATLILSLVITLVAALLVMRVVRNWLGIGPALVGGILTVHGAGALQAFGNGMETPVVLLALALVLTAAVAWFDTPTARNGLLTGLACALLVLARLDYALLIALVPVGFAIRRRSVRLTVPWFMGVAALGLPIGLAWLIRWRHVLTTSAAVKQHVVSTALDRQYGGRLSPEYLRWLVDESVRYGRRILLSTEVDGLPGRLGSTVAWLFAFVVAYAVITGARRPSRWLEHARDASTTAWAVGTLLVLTAGKGALDLVVAPYWAASWYAGPVRFATTFTLGVLTWVAVSRLWSGGHQPFAVAAGAVVVLAVLPLGWTSLRSASVVAPPQAWQPALDEAASWVAAEGPPGRYGAASAGLIGYRLDEEPDKQLVNLDGLVNNYAFVDLVRSDASGLERARATGVEYLIDRFEPDDLGGELACAEVIWTSSRTVLDFDTKGQIADLPIRVLDLSTCP